VQRDVNGASKKPCKVKALFLTGAVRRNKLGWFHAAKMQFLHDNQRKKQ